MQRVSTQRAEKNLIVSFLRGNSGKSDFAYIAPVLDNLSSATTPQE